MAVVWAMVVSLGWMILVDMDVTIWVRFPLACGGFMLAFKMVGHSHHPKP